MSTLREAAQQALEALENSSPDNARPECVFLDKHQEAIAALRAALAQEEPVASQNTQEKCRIETVPAKGGLLSIHPPRRETEQEPVALFTKYGPPTMRDRDFWSAGYAAGAARAVEAALKERNT